MGEVVNLKRARKARTRAEQEAGAEANRLKFGRSKAQRLSETAEKDRAAQALEGHKREP